MRTRIQRKGIYFYCYAESVWRSLEPSVKCGRSGSTPPSQCRFLRPTLSCLGCGPSLYICAFTTVPQVQGLHSQPHIHTQRTLITSLCHTSAISGYSSVGRASDCRPLQQSDGPWFDSGWPDIRHARHKRLGPCNSHTHIYTNTQ